MTPIERAMRALEAAETDSNGFHVSASFERRVAIIKRELEKAVPAPQKPMTRTVEAMAYCRGQAEYHAELCKRIGLGGE